MKFPRKKNERRDCIGFNCDWSGFFFFFFLHLLFLCLSAANGRFLNAIPEENYTKIDDIKYDRMIIH